MNEKIKAGADIHAGDGGYEEGTMEKYEAFVKVRNQSLVKMRIKELAVQAGIIGISETTVAPTIEKFAELIVRECSQYVLDTVKYTTPRKESPMLATALAKRIKQHFGVE